MKILVLYTELADYTMACLQALQARGNEIDLVHWPINPEAPFKFDFSCVNRRHERGDDGALKAFVADQNYSAVMCSGWVDRTYLSICRSLKAQMPTVLTMDNHWVGAPKQRLAQLLAPLTLRRAFSHAFVPGSPQRVYARKLGFKNQRIATGFYAANLTKFNTYFDPNKYNSTEERPLRFLYIGRYIRHKGIHDMWTAFSNLRSKHQHVEMWCCGTGELYNDRPTMDGLKHFGFVQPSDLEPILKQTDVYILPSHFEPWGVAVQELAAAGFPLLLSDAIGAKEAYLKAGENGFEFQANNASDLEKSMERIVEFERPQLADFSHRSHQLAQKNSPEAWAETFTNLIA